MKTTQSSILVTTCHYIIIEGHSKNDFINLNGIETESSRNEALLGVALDNDLKFDAHIKSLSRKAAQKLSVLSRTNKYLPYDQKLLFVNSVLISQFKVLCYLQFLKKTKFVRIVLNHF